MFSTWFKPAGIPCFPPHADPGGDCVLARLRAEQPERFELDWPPGFEGGIAHRLDVDTSGALVVADDPDALQRVRRLFADGALTKTYWFQASRDVPWDRNQCDRPIAHDRRRKRRMVVQRGRSTPHRGRWYPARTSFRRLDGDLWEATIRSGVTHQVRVHAAFVGLPLVGDALYGGGSGGHRLHHVGLVGPDGLRTDPVPAPWWARRVAG